MSDLENDLLAVRIRHYGQCTQERGHAAEAVVRAVMITFALTVLLIAVCNYFLSQVPELKQEAIKRGYALHNPTTGKFEWR